VTRQQVSRAIVDSIMTVPRISPITPYSHRRPAKIATMNPYLCRICGAVVDVLTDAHAQKCGFADKHEMIRKGAVKRL
jgi:predicted Zn-ribbon and HTH transcriptional regulator